MSKYTLGDNAVHIVNAHGDCTQIAKDVLARVTDYDANNTFGFFECAHITVAQAVVAELKRLNVKFSVFRKTEVTDAF